MDRASGRYEPQPGGFAAFIPDALPPADLTLTAPVQALLSRADREVGRLDGAVAIIPAADQFVSMFVRHEAVLSSQIEGTQASLMDVLEYEALTSKSAGSVDIHEVINYIKAMQYGIDQLDKLPLSSRLIKKVHAVLMEGVRGGEPAKTPGEFRRCQNWIGGAGPDSARFVPPPADYVTAAMADLDVFMNSLDQPTPPLVAAGLIHAQFETIHPFLDGNGRTGRLMITFWMLEQKVISQPVLYPSLYLKKEQAEYYRRLDAVRTHGDWHGWLQFFLGAMTQAAKEASQIALAIVELQQQHRQLVTHELGRRSGLGLRLLDLLYQQPVLNAALVMQRLESSQPTVSALLRQFCQIGVLREITGATRGRVYAYQPYLDLFPGASQR